jgi:transposase
VRQAVEGAGRRLEYLPAYSPDLNPIELAFTRLKRLLRSDEYREVPALTTFLETAAGMFRPGECVNYIRHCGYRDRPPCQLITNIVF